MYMVTSQTAVALELFRSGTSMTWNIDSGPRLAPL